MGLIIVKGSEQVLVLGVREALIYPAVIPDWLDVRVGAFVSLTKASADDDPTALTETLTTTGDEADRLWFGVKDNTNSLPRSSCFFGISNSLATEGAGSSLIESIDSSTRWKARNATVPTGVLVNDGTTISVDGTMEPFRTVQNPATIGGYATLVLLRLVRGAVLAGNTADHLYVAKTTDVSDFADAGVETSTPTIQLIRDNFRSAVWTEVLPGGHTFAVAPNTFYAYWPYSNSRLRIHAIVVEKFS
jgi:hypothetical protein